MLAPSTSFIYPDCHSNRTEKNAYIFVQRGYMESKYHIDESGHAIIPDGATEIPDYAFDSCNNLKSVDIPNTVVTIGHRAFYRCSSLANIVFPNSLREIGAFAFDGCSFPKAIIPEGVTTIGECAFYSSGIK